VASYREALRLRPNYPEAHNNLGAAQRYQGQLDEAVASYREALRLRPDYADAHNNLGDARKQQGRLDEAVASYREALRLRPNYPEAHNNLGAALVRQGQYDEAIAHHREALRLRPRFPDACNNLGNAFLMQKKLDEAAACYREAVALKPEYAEALANLGIVLAGQRKHDEAVACYKKALQLKPDYPEALVNLGNVLLEQGKPGEALAIYEQALQLHPDSAAAHDHRSQALLAQGKLDEALAGFGQAIHLRPDHAGARMGRALTLLLLGHFEEGWVEYEWRWKCKEFSPWSYPQPPWDGSPLDGRTILLHAEQGLGDTLHFIRYAALVKERGGRVVVACQKPLLRLLASCPGIDQLVPYNEPLPDFDVHTPLLSLPRIFGTTLATVPANIPYLFADPALLGHWQRELSSYRTFRIGIAWQGNPDYPGDAQRSFPLAQLAPLARVGGVQLLSLQKTHGMEQLRTAPFPVIDLGSRLDETSGPFMDTAAVIKNLDLVICPNTALVHLAGALGVPVWLALPLNPEWRWLWNRADSPWYPTVRLFRQEQTGDWAGVFARMATELAVRMRCGRRTRGVPVEVSPGELLDRMTHLEIMAERCTVAAQLDSIRSELGRLAAVRDRALPPSPELAQLVAELKAVHEALWESEDGMRLCEQNGEFGDSFILLAKAVCHHNDRRLELQLHLNDLLGPG
jgi:tetratricopeptide (TPR) repeat protein